MRVTNFLQRYVNLRFVYKRGFRVLVNTEVFVERLNLTTRTEELLESLVTLDYERIQADEVGRLLAELQPKIYVVSE